jgi:ribosomal protein L7/L12
MESVVFVLFCVGIVAVVIAINYIAVTRQERRGEIPVSRWTVDQIDWDAIADEQLQDALHRGNKIEAIKRYRELTGAGLKEAKDSVVYAEKHPDEWAEKKKAPRLELDAPGIRDLLEAGRDEEAIEVYQKFAGVDEYSARDAVARIKDEMSHR